MKNLELTLHRIYLTDTFTIGELTIDSKYICDTLEDKVRPDTQSKVYGKTAIPAGTYNIVLSYSPRFKKILPEVLDVPGFTGIRIHSGNSSKDTEGCILVGEWDGKTADWISNSRVTFNKLFKILDQAIKDGNKITLTIKNIVSNDTKQS